MPYMTFIMLRADYLCRKQIETYEARRWIEVFCGVWGGTGASRAEAM